MQSVTSPVPGFKPSVGKSLVKHEPQIMSVMGVEGQNQSKDVFPVMPAKPLSFKGVWIPLWKLLSG